MNTNRSKPVSLAVLRTLRCAKTPLSRSEIAGLVQTTIKRLSPMLEGMVEQGLVEESTVGLRILYRVRSTRAADCRMW